MPLEKNPLAALAMVEDVDTTEETPEIAAAFTLIVDTKGECGVMPEAVIHDKVFPVNYDLLLTTCLRVIEDLRFARQLSAIKMLKENSNDGN